MKRRQNPDRTGAPRTCSPASGRFVLRIDPQLHEALRTAAHQRGLSLNDYCARRLAAPDGGSESEEAADAIRRAVLLFGDDLVGIVAFGSWVRGEAATTSDVDLLVVVDQSRPLTRDLYRRWDEGPVTWGGRPVEPHFVHLPEAASVAGGVWAEAAMDGIVQFERQRRVSQQLALVRREILSGRLVRRLVHGQPYWTEVA